MHYGEPVPHGKSNFSLEVVTFPRINISGYNFNIMNTRHVMSLYQFAVNPAQCQKKLAVSSK